MIKKFLLAICVAIPAVICAQTAKFGTVDVEAIIPNMPEYAQANAHLQEATNKYESEYKTLQDEMNKKMAEFQQLSNDANTPQAIKDRRVQEIQELDERAKQFLATARQHLESQNAQLMQPIQEKMINAIKQVGAENGFTMIFPVGAAIYESTDVVDVTPLVKAKLGIQ